MFGRLRAWLHTIAPAAPTVDAPRPAWVDELAESLQKQSRSATKQAARLEALIGEYNVELRSALVELKQSALTASTSTPVPTGHYEDLFDALDALDQASSSAVEPHLAEGLVRLRQRIERFCERSGYSRVSGVGQPVDPALMRIVGTQAWGEMPAGAVARVVCAAITHRGQLVREGQVILRIEEKHDESQLGN